MTVNPDGSEIREIFRLEQGKNFGGRWDCYCIFRWSPDYKHLLLTVGGRSYPDQTFIVRGDGQGNQSFNSDYYQFKWSPDGKYLAYLYYKGRQYGANQGELYLANGDGTNGHLFTDRKITDFAWSPDGKQLAISSLGTIFVTSVDGKPESKRLTTNDLHVDNLNWLSGGAKIGFVYRSVLYLLDVKTQLRRKVNIPIDYYGYTPSPDGRKLLTRSTLVNVEDGAQRILHYPDNYNDSATLLKWSPDSSRVLYSKSNSAIPGNLYAWDLTNNAPGKLNSVIGASWMRDGVWSPDSRQIAYQVERQICIMNVDSSLDHCITKPDQYGEVARLQWAYEAGFQE
jgi:Tol biopolymer transport system component